MPEEQELPAHPIRAYQLIPDPAPGLTPTGN